MAASPNGTNAMAVLRTKGRKSRTSSGRLSEKRKTNCPITPSSRQRILAFCIGTVLVFCFSATTTTTTNAFFLPAPKKPSNTRITSSRSGLICQRMSNSSGDGDEFERENSNKNEQKGIVTVVPSSDPEQRKDLVDAVFKGKSQVATSADDDEKLPVLDKMDAFLDKPFFDPDAYDDDDDSMFGKFARLVKNDYELFEAVFVACFFLLLITVAKDLLRAQMAASVVPSGRLF
mmetsp:Transcript_1511/g.3338  ORF Transcript_1511/g.3338 Transcript_1511/m.3338 type:complete len:232 (-) Transcript_1511:526-1221(-)